MSVKHPVIAITGSSGAGTSTVTKSFAHVFRREKITAAIIEGDSFHKYDRKSMKEAAAEQAKLDQNPEGREVLRRTGGLTLRPENDTLWVENSCLPATWRLTREHVITGVPRNNWPLDLPPGICLDIVPVGDSQYCIRVYGIDDDFRVGIGQVGAFEFDDAVALGDDPALPGEVGRGRGRRA